MKEVLEWVKDVFSELGVKVSFLENEKDVTFVVWGSKKAEEAAKKEKGYRYPVFHYSFSKRLMKDENALYRTVFAAVVYGLWNYDFDFVDYAYPIFASPRSKVLVGVKMECDGKRLEVMLKDKENVSISLGGDEGIVVPPKEFCLALRDVVETLAF